MKQELKIHIGKEFPKQFWNYRICPITGFTTHEKSVDETRDKRKYYSPEINTNNYES